MEYTSIYRRFRPKTFDDVIGQDHIVRTLTNQIKNGNVSHAYLFTGTRGTGKTSCAKILSRAVNCLTPNNGSPCGNCYVCKTLSENTGVDIIEIDAASNNGVEEIRTIKENVMYRPTVGKYKVYIIDEVHMLSSSAFNALLKTLEEPPEHIVFILATTEVQKLPATILSRCIRFDFRLIDVEGLVALLRKIFGELNVKYDERALIKIAVGGEGSVRDTLSIADTCMSYCGGEITYEDTLEVLSATDFDTLDYLASAILDGDTGKALTSADNLLRMGRTTLGRDLANYYNELITVKNAPNYKSKIMTDDEFNKLKQRAEKYSDYRIGRVMEIMAGIENQLKFASQPRILMQATIVKACSLMTETTQDGVIGRIKDLESQIEYLNKNGVAITPARPPQNRKEENIEENKPQNKKESVDLKSILSKEAVEIEEKPIFEETEVVQDIAKAKEIWSRVVERLGENNELSLRIACESINKGMKVVGDEFILTVDDNATYERLNRPIANKTLTDLIKTEGGQNMKFICRKYEEKGASAQSKIALNDMFSGKVHFKR